MNIIQTALFKKPLPRAWYTMHMYQTAKWCHWPNLCHCRRKVVQVCNVSVHCGIASRSVYPVKNEFSKAWIQDIKWSALYWYYNVDKMNLINFIVQELAILIISLRCYKRDPARHAWQLKILTYQFINRTLISKSNCIQKSLIKGMLSSQAVGVLKCNDILIVKVF